MTPSGPDPVVAATSLYRFFRAADAETLALQGVSLTVSAGEVLAVIGPSGSGKSTLLSCLAGIDDPDGGTVRIAGVPISHQPEARRAHLRARTIGLLFQSRNLLGHLSVRRNIDLAQGVAGAAPRQHPDILLASLGIDHLGPAYPEALSGGELARAGLAVALANNPAVVLADEPTGELDTATEGEVLALLRRRAEAGTAILIASHSSAVAATADRIVRLSDGRLQP